MIPSEYRATLPRMKTTLFAALAELTRKPLGELASLDTEMEAEIDAMERAGIPRHEIDWARKENRGGECTICGRPWRRITVENIFVRTFYYEPDCLCYPLCCYCERPLYREILCGVTCCLNCGVHLRCQKVRTRGVRVPAGKEVPMKTWCRGRIEIQNNGALICMECGEPVLKLVRYEGELRKEFTYPLPLSEQPVVQPAPKKKVEQVKEEAKPVESAKVGEPMAQTEELELF